MLTTDALGVRHARSCTCCHAVAARGNAKVGARQRPRGGAPAQVEGTSVHRTHRTTRTNCRPSNAPAWVPGAGAGVRPAPRPPRRAVFCPDSKASTAWLALALRPKWAVQHGGAREWAPSPQPHARPFSRCATTPLPRAAAGVRWRQGVCEVIRGFRAGGHSQSEGRGKKCPTLEAPSCLPASAAMATAVQGECEMSGGAVQGKITSHGWDEGRGLRNGAIVRGAAMRTRLVGALGQEGG